MPVQFTKRIRLAVAINQAGEWQACGGCDLEYQEAKLNALETLADGSHGRGSNLIVYWLEADVPLAQANILQAEVKGHELEP
jgi:hypothetical protein